MFACVSVDIILTLTYGVHAQHIIEIDKENAACSLSTVRFFTHRRYRRRDRDMQDARALDTAWVAERADEVRRTGATLIRNVLPVDKIDELNQAFLPLLATTAQAEENGNRGPNRYYVTPPFRPPWTDVSIIDNDLIMAVVSELVGHDGVFCQLAVNFPLVDCRPENGPLEITPSTHLLDKDEALRRIESGDIVLEQVLMNRGDVLIRDVRHIHRGSPNHTDQPRPMVVLGYSRRWLFRPEVQIRLARQVMEQLPVQTRKWLRFNPVFDSFEEADKKEELYRTFAY